MKDQRYLGVDLGGTKCAVVLGDGASNVLARNVFATGADRSPEVIMQQILACAYTILRAQGLSAEALCAVGVSCGGPLDSAKGVVQSPPNLPLWDNFPITDELSRALGCPAFLQNDANACALAEWHFGAGKGCKNMIFLTFGTGLGAGLILDGRLYEGTNGLSGEVGHMRLSNNGPMGYGKVGSFEGYCSGSGLARLTALRAKEHGFSEYPQTAKALASDAQRGDSFALSVIRESAEKLGQGLSLLVDILNPELIVIGSIYARCEALYRDIVREVLEQEALPASTRACRVLPTALGETIGDIACLTVAMEGMGEK